MKIAILGNGGREHAIATKISKSPKLQKLYCIPGNAGTDLIAENVELDFHNYESLLKFIKEKKIDLVIVGPEKPLVGGIVDFLSKENVKVFGPNKKVSQLEGSKTFSKDFFVKYGIPTAGYSSFDDFESANNYLETIDYPTVVKADGLAAGKGVIICKNKKES